MKSILYVGATLMIGASIYGFVDYRKTSNSKEFENMYKAEVPDPIEIKTEEKISVVEKPVVVMETKKAEKAVSIKKKTAPKKKIKEVTVVENEIIEPVDIIEVEAPEVAKDILEISNTEKEFKTEKKKKISTKMFSRGSMEDRYVEKLKKKS